MNNLFGLNDQQRAAVEHDDGNLLIVAGPGTGKTRTLVARVVRLAQGLKSPQKVLAITFTNKAADEMRERLGPLLADGQKRVEVGTFHAFALRLLREYGGCLPHPCAEEGAGPNTRHPSHALPIEGRVRMPPRPWWAGNGEGAPGSQFTIATPDDIAALAAEFLPNASKRERRDLLKKVSDWKSSLEAEAADPAINAFRAFLREQRLVDFDDILRDAVFLLRDNADIAAEVRGRYPFIGVDEYQDVNSVQVELLKLLVKNDVRITVIGDPNQAIYGFRGSDVTFFRDFEKTFPPCTRVELADNYRSAGNLLEASGQVIRSEKAGGLAFSVPELIARIHREGRLVIRETSGEKAEALYVAGEIGRLIGATGHHGLQAGHEGGGYSFQDIAVLFRLNAQARAFETVFAERGIPFQTAGVRQAGLSLASRRALRNLESPAQLLPELERLRSLDPVLAADWERVAAFARQVKGVEEFLDRLSLETPEDAYAAKAEKVALLTLHAAKGLEFPVVFIVGCEDGLLPLTVIPSSRLESYAFGRGEGSPGFFDKG